MTRRKKMKAHSQQILLFYSGNGKSINCTHKKRKKGCREGKHVLKQLSKHRLRAHNTITTAGKGKSVAGNGRESEAETQWAREFGLRLR